MSTAMISRRDGAPWEVCEEVTGSQLLFPGLTGHADVQLLYHSATRARWTHPYCLPYRGGPTCTLLPLLVRLAPTAKLPCTHGTPSHAWPAVRVYGRRLGIGHSWFGGSMPGHCCQVVTSNAATPSNPWGGGGGLGWHVQPGSRPP